MNYFTVELDENGEPVQLCGPGTLQACKTFAAAIAREWGIAEDRIQEDILDSDLPGLTSDPTGLVHDACGIFVIAGDPLPDDEA